MRINEFITICLLLVSVSLFAQEKTIEVTGVVTDTNKEPLVGVNVTVKDKPGLGAITDINGEFSLPKKEGNAILTAHYIGYNPVSIPADTSKTMLIAMHENKTTLNEVVVTGYGTQKKVAVTGAISAVSIKDLKKASVDCRNQQHQKMLIFPKRPIHYRGLSFRNP